jgi:hypothetical protein
VAYLLPRVSPRLWRAPWKARQSFARTQLLQSGAALSVRFFPNCGSPSPLCRSTIAQVRVGQAAAAGAGQPIPHSDRRRDWSSKPARAVATVSTPIVAGTANRLVELAGASQIVMDAVASTRSSLKARRPILGERLRQAVFPPCRGCGHRRRFGRGSSGIGRIWAHGRRNHSIGLSGLGSGMGVNSFTVEDERS